MTLYQSLFTFSSIFILSIPMLSKYYFDNFSHFVYSLIPVSSTGGIFTPMQSTQDHNGGTYKPISYMLYIKHGNQAKQPV